MLEDNKYFHYYNANPKNKREKDCTYRAISLFLGISWEDVARIDAEFYLKHGMWLYTTEYIGTGFKSGLGELMEENGCKLVFKNSLGSDINSMRDFIDKYAKSNKVYLCELGNHMVAIKNKKVCDTWDSSEMLPNMIFEKNLQTRE